MLQALSEGLAALGIEPRADLAEALLAYRDELARWNRVHNLSGVRNPDAMVSVHLLDSLALLPLLRGDRLADVGSGGGLPGLPLAIARPDCAVVLIESRHKRALFLEHVVRTLGLGNVIVECCRAEDLSPGEGFATVTARAFGTLAAFIAAAGHLCRPGGCLLAAKGRAPRAELAGVPDGWHARVTPLTVPGIEAARHAVYLEPRAVAGGPAMSPASS